MTEQAARESMATIMADLEAADLTHFVVYAKHFTVERPGGDYRVIVGTVFRDILAIDEPGDWPRDKWMLGVGD